jgi:hypothetical protein
VLKSGGYGSVTITKALSIIAPPGIYAGISVFPGQTGITVNAPAARVMLRGLTVNGLDGDDGVRVLSAETLIVDRCVISNSGDGASDVGIRLSADNLRAFIRESVVRGSSGRGIVVDGGTSPSLVVWRSRIIDSAGNGIEASVAGVIAVYDSVVSHNGGAGYAHQVPAGQTTSTAIVRSTLARNTAWGVYADEGTGSHVVALADNEIGANGNHGVANGDESDGVIVMTRNKVDRNGGSGLSNNGATIRSAGDNVVDSNAAGDVGAVSAATVK